MSNLNKPWILLPDTGTEGWRVVVDGSAAHKNALARAAHEGPIPPQAVCRDPDPDDGGVLGCSEWFWGSEEDLRHIVELHNAALARVKAGEK